MSRFITDQVVFRCFLYKNFTFILHSKFYIVKDEQLFYNRAKSQLDIFGYSSVSELQSFPPLATRLRGFRDRKVKLKNICKFGFRLNCKQRLTFLLAPISDNRFMSVDAAQFCLCKNPMNCLLSMNKSARRCVFCTVSKTWQIGHPRFGVKTYIEMI